MLVQDWIKAAPTNLTFLWFTHVTTLTFTLTNLLAQMLPTLKYCILQYATKYPVHWISFTTQAHVVLTKIAPPREISTIKMYQHEALQILINLFAWFSKRSRWTLHTQFSTHKHFKGDTRQRYIIPLWFSSGRAIIKLDSQAASQQVSQPARKQVNLPASQPPNQLGSQLSNQHVRYSCICMTKEQLANWHALRSSTFILHHQSCQWVVYKTGRAQLLNLLKIIVLKKYSDIIYIGKCAVWSFQWLKVILFDKKITNFP